MVIGQMDLDEMASLIIEMFTDVDDWTHVMLAWWNVCVLSNLDLLVYFF